MGEAAGRGAQNRWRGGRTPPISGCSVTHPAHVGRRHDLRGSLLQLLLQEGDLMGWSARRGAHRKAGSEDSGDMLLQCLQGRQSASITFWLLPQGAEQG